MLGEFKSFAYVCFVIQTGRCKAGGILHYVPILNTT